MDQTESAGFDLGGAFDKGLDTIGKLLLMDSANEQARLDRRLAETRMQAELWGIPSRPMNPQARSQSYGTVSGFFAVNPWAMPALLLVGGYLLFKAVK